MSLETLLEAAQWVESSSKDKTREDSSRNFHHYAKSPSISEDNSDGRIEDSREKRRTGGVGTREVHNKLEKNRRAHLKECFDVLKKQIPQMEEKKTSNLSVLRGSLKLIQTLKRKERENELELQRLAQVKSRLRDRFDRLNSELDQLNVKVNLEHFMKVEQDMDSNSTSTASEGPETPPGSDDEQYVQSPVDLQPPVAIARSIPHPVIRIVSKANPTLVASQQQSDSSSLQSLGPQLAPLNLVMTTTPAASATSTALQPSPLVMRPPVTQLLQQRLERRQAQSKQQQSGATEVSTVMSSQAMRQMVKAMPSTIPAGLVTFPSMVSLVTAPAVGVGTGSVALPANHAKALSQSLLLTPSSTHTLVSTPNHTPTTPPVLQAPLGMGGATVITPIRGTPSLTTVTTSMGLNAASLGRPLLTAAVQGAAVTTPQVLGPLAFGHHQLLTHFPRGTTVSGVGVGGLPMVSLGPGGQMLSPLTVMAPGLGMLTSPLLKQFPILQQHQLLTGAQVLHTAQQQPQQSVVNPLVVMSMPSVVTTTTATTTPAVATGTKVTS